MNKNRNWTLQSPFTVAGILLLGLAAGAFARNGAEAKAVGEMVPGTYPLAIYEEGQTADPLYAASGWMGNMEAIQQEESCTLNPHSGDTCIRVRLAKSSEFLGVAWQRPANDWGLLPGGLDLSNAKRVTFWAKGGEGGEKVTFRVGLLREGQKYRDSMATSPMKVTLTKQWKQYTINLSGNKSFIKTGFVWMVDRCGEGFTFYLDDIRIE